MIHISSTYTADVLHSNLSLLLQKFCNQSLCFHYNQIFQQALLPNSEFNVNEDGLNVILIRNSDLFSPEKNSKDMFNDLIGALNKLQLTMKVPLLIIFTPTQTSTKSDKEYYLSLEHDLKLALEPNVNTLLISSDEVQKNSKSSLIFDNLTEQYGHIPYTIDFYDSLALLIARTYSLLTRKPYKVIVLDCDGTLWKGIVEEDGINGLVIKDEYLALQHFMVRLFEAGFLLCLCSKNSESSVLNVFQKHQDMVLDINKHICSHRINWLPKSSNIQSLAEELDLNLDSFIFIDDNYVECAEVKTALPQVLSIHLPEHSRMDYLHHIWAFDLKNQSSEDASRTEFYKQNKLRHTLQSQSISFSQFLTDLRINTQIREANQEDADRVIQLSQRTNQFNLFPNAFSDIELNNRIVQQQNGCLVIEVSDKYGDYGLVGSVIYDLTDNEVFIRAFFLSCRILGREVEYTILNYLSQLAEKNNKKSIKLLFKITEKNIPGIGFLQHVAGQLELTNVEHVELPLHDVKKIKPKAAHTTHKNKKNTDKKLSASNDYMLDIAKDYGAKPTDLKHNKLITVEISLLELLKKHHLIVSDYKSIPFVELGINSLTCVLIASAIYQQFHVELKPFELLKHDFTFDTLTRYVSDHIATNKQEQSKPINLDLEYSPLSSIQKHLWEEEHILQGTNRNNMFTAYQIESDVDIKLMEQTFGQLMTRHDSLRFSFLEQDNEPVLKLNSLQDINFKIKQFSSNNDEEIEQFVIQFRTEPFNLSQAPLFRVAIIKKKECSILLFCIHHIIHDGWSLNVLIEELSTIYNAYSDQLPLPFMSKPSSYVQFIQWQQQHISTEVLKEQLQFWKKQLHHMPKLDLIYDKTRKNRDEKPLNHRIPFTIDAKVAHKLKQLSSSNQVTLYNILSSTFGLFLSHYTDQNDINFITALSGRNHSSIGNCIGLFTNLVLIRMHIDNQESFDDVVRNNKKTIDAVLKNQDVSFNQIMQLTGEHVNSRLHSFNQAGFIFQSYPLNKLIINDKIGKRVFGDDKAELLYDSCNECRFGSLVCFMQEFESELHCMFEYNTSLFDQKRIKDMIHSFTTLIQNIADTPNIPARSIPVVSPAQSKVLVHAWNQPHITYPEHLNLLHYFSEQVQAREHAIAVQHKESQITYGELDKISNQLARVLVKSGVTREVPVGILLTNNIARIIAMLGIIKAGGCYVPLDLDMPAYRMEHIIEDTSLSLVIINDKKGSTIIKNNYPEIQSISITDQAIQSESNTPLPNTTSPKQLAYIMYTSGSTGKPKGITIEQSGILRLVKSPNYIDIDANDCIAQSSSFFFDAATFEIWGALLNGATLVLVDKNNLLNASSLHALINDKKISIIFLTTQLFHTYSYLIPDLFQRLKYLLVGGEALSYEAVKRVLNKENRPTHLLNVYGPTENTTFSTAYFIKNIRDLLNPIPIGTPISGTQLYVLDHALNLSPIGAPGVLYIGGTGLARGYIQEHLNKDRFINYFGERLYNTGDVVSWQPDGNIRYLGRKDNQIKINGHRVELDEIEAQLRTHHYVEQAIVLVKNDDYHKLLTAYILLKPGIKLSDINLYHYLKTILPHYMLPQIYYQIYDIPLTTQGKVDKKMLLKQQLEAINYTEYTPPTNLLQEQLLDVYAELLNNSPNEISINSEFFDLGGTSISALHLIAKVNQQFDVKLTFSDIYEHASVKLLSERITFLQSSEASSANATNTQIDTNSLKIIKAGDSQKTPIVFVHPIGGTGFCYLNLIKILPDDQPCYLIQDPSIDADQICFESMQVMAAYYNKLLLKELSGRKFILAGYSFGGMLSLEMTSQLEAQKSGDVVESIITFDTWVVSNFLNVEAREALRISIMNKYAELALMLKKEHIDPKPWMELYYSRLQNLGFAYNPPKINKKIILFKANQQLNEFSAMNHATNYLDVHTSQKVEVFPVSGTHDSILQYPHVKDIGCLLSQYLKGS